jgi:hypothetical protein
LHGGFFPYSGSLISIASHRTALHHQLVSFSFSVSTWHIKRTHSSGLFFIFALNQRKKVFVVSSGLGRAFSRHILGDGHFSISMALVGQVYLKLKAFY